MASKILLSVRELRPHQWVKNLLVFIPILGAHRLGDRGLLVSSILAFCAFCCAASCIYVINDLCDLRADRTHASKRRRPFASGALPTSWGLPLALALAAGAIAFSWTLAPWLKGVLAAYAGTSLLYSLGLKRVALLDVFVLAGLYVIRLVGGHVATGLPFSPWMLGFCLFFFLCLAFLKRYTELRTLLTEQRSASEGRGYTAQDLDAVRLFGIASGYLSVLVFALYINSDVVRVFYRTPAFLWGIAPLLLLWISRMWLSAQRGSMDADPVVFALRDPAGYVIAVAGVGFFAAASVA